MLPTAVACCCACHWQIITYLFRRLASGLFSISMLPTAVGAALAITMLSLIAMLPTGNAVLAIACRFRFVAPVVSGSCLIETTMLPTGNAALAIASCWGCLVGGVGGALSCLLWLTHSCDLSDGHHRQSSHYHLGRIPLPVGPACTLLWRRLVPLPWRRRCSCCCPWIYWT
jgi:hypothetical protein